MTMTDKRLMSQCYLFEIHDTLKSLTRKGILFIRTQKESGELF
jgi:hypothetical protein